MGMHQMLGPSFGSGADYEIERSLRFNSGDSSSLTRTPSSASNRKTWTWSGWIKKSKFGENVRVFQARSGTSGNQTFIQFRTNDKIYVGGNSDVFLVNTGAIFRDPGSWGHLCVSFDTTQSTAADRIRIFWNGVQQTLSGTQPSQDYSTAQINTTLPHAIGGEANSSSEYFNGYLAEVHFTDGQALTASDFGEYDDDNNWVPKRFSGSYGSNGFYLKFADNSTSAALGTDSSGNSNTWTVNNLQAAAGVASDALTAVSFDGVDDKLTLGTDSNLSLSGVFTLEAWIYRVGNNNEVGIYEGSAGGVGSCVVRVASNKLGLERHNTAFDILTSSTVPYDEWVHIAVTRDGSNTCRAFINGVLGGTSTSNSQTYSGNFRVGQTNNGYWQSAVSNLRLIKGTCLYTSNFTPPTTPLSNVTNTVLLICQDSSSATAATVKPYGTTIGTGGSPTAGSYPTISADEIDSLIDSPTNYEADSGNNGGNYCTWNSLAKSNDHTLSNGNLDSSFSNATPTSTTVGTIGMTSGKFYWESTLTAQTGSNSGVAGLSAVSSGMARPGNDANTWMYNSSNGNIYHNNTNTSYGATYAVGDVIGTAFDADNGNLYFYKNGVVQNSGTAAATGLTSGPYFPAIGDISVSNTFTASTNFGQRPFAYTPPTGYVSLCTTNLADPTIADGSDYFETKIWTGDGSSSRSITGYDFSPDLIWGKSRSNTNAHWIMDTVRGAGKRLEPNANDAEDTPSGIVTSFDSNGFTMGSNTENNGSGRTYVAWAWDAGSSTVSNTDGSVTSQVRVNQSAGCSIVSYTATGSNLTVGHGLNATPALIIHKTRSVARDWVVYHESLGLNYILKLNLLDAKLGPFTNIFTSVSSSTFGTGTNSGINTNNETKINYCFAPVAGFSAFGTYTGNGSNDGPFVYTGFRPRWVLRKCSSTGGSGYDWVIIDTERNLNNISNNKLYPNHIGVENVNSDASDSGDNSAIDILSNGFKVRASNGRMNQSGQTFIYAAFAEHPFKTARAR